MYIRVEIYDGKNERYYYNAHFKRIGVGIVGYYNDSNYEIAKNFSLPHNTLGIIDELISKEEYNSKEYLRQQINLFYSSYEDYEKNLYNDFYNDTLVKLSNEYVANNSEIPTVVQFIGNKLYEDGKYEVDFFAYSGFYDGYQRGLITTKAAIETEQAQKMLKANKDKNNSKKLDAEREIANLQILNNEAQIQMILEEEAKNAEEQNKVTSPNSNISSNSPNQNVINNGEPENKIKQFNIMDIIVFSSIGLVIVICIITIIIDRKVRHKKI